ncbi:MAG TPA: hypothetical protein VG897_14235 [Terriglobales bacterium]|nr:hypothetical protein [Terriglobales bacterium]
MSRKYISAACAGVVIAVLVYLIDALLAHLGLHAESTYVDDALLGIAVAVLVFLLQWQHERELRRQRQMIAVIELMNHHIRNALQVIVYRANLDNNAGEFEDITNAVDRIDHALSEILPSINGENAERILAQHEMIVPKPKSRTSAPR